MMAEMPSKRSCEYPDCSGPVVTVPGKQPQCYACGGKHDGVKRATGDNRESGDDHYQNVRALVEADPDDYP